MRKRENYHENVDIAVTKINELRRNEDESLDKILKSTASDREFRVKFAAAYALPMAIEITGKWNSSHGEIFMNVKDNKLFGETETKINPPVTNALAALKLSSAAYAAEDTKQRIIIHGIVNNRSIEYELQVESISTSSDFTLLGTGKREVYQGLMYAAEDVQIMNVMEWKLGKKDIEIYEMKKVG